MEPELKKSNKRNVIIIAGIVAAITLAVGIGVVVYSDNPSKRLQEQLDLGARYLSELDYEQAIAAYEAALEIDPKSVDAYRGLLDSYGGNGNPEGMLAVYEMAESRLEEDDLFRVGEALMEQAGTLAEHFMQQGDYPAANKVVEMLEGVSLQEEQTGLISLLKQQIDDAWIDALIENRVPGSALEEITDAALLRELHGFLDRFCVMASVPEGRTPYDFRRKEECNNLIGELLFPISCVELERYPFYAFDEQRPFDNPQYVPDPLERFHELGYRRYAASNIDWILTHVFHCSEEEITTMRSGNKSTWEFYYHENAYYTLWGGIGWASWEWELIDVHRDGRFYVATAMLSQTDGSLSFHRAVLSRETTESMAYWTLYYLGDMKEDDTKARSKAAMYAYRTILKDDQWDNLMSFALFDFNRDGVSEMLTTSGANSLNARIFAFNGTEAEEVFLTTWIDVYDNGIMQTIFHQSGEYDTESFYRLDDTLTFERVETSLYDYMNDRYYNSYEAYERGDAPVPEAEVKSRIDSLMEGAQRIELEYHENTAENRERYLR